MLRLSIVLLAALALGTDLQADSVTARSVLKDVSSKVQFHTLSNGLRVLLYPRGEAPVLAGAVVVRVGGSDELTGETGISHLFEHMAFKGTPEIGTKNFSREKVLLAELEAIVASNGAELNFSPEVKSRWDVIQTELASIWNREQFVRELRKRGASELNATTDKELTRYFMSLPRAAFEYWCWIESERLLRPVMREFYQERDVVLEEKRMRFVDDPGGRAYESLLQLSFFAHPYRNPVIGYDEDIRSLTATRLEAFRKTYYVPSNIAVAVVGAVNPVQDLKVIEKYFGRLPVGLKPPRPSIVEPVQLGQRELSLELKAAPQMLLSYHKPNYPHQDDPALSLALEIFAGSRTSPLYSELVKKRQVAADAGHAEGPGGAYPNLAMFYMTPRSPHSNQEVLKAFDLTLERFLREPIREIDLTRAKRRIAVEHILPLKNNLSMALDLASSELIYNNWGALLDWYDKAMAVTVDDVQRAARKYLQETTRNLVRVETRAETKQLGAKS
jgi:predicted Zn-dependent peptidase